MENGLWLVLAVALGLLSYSLTSIFVNGFNLYMLYPLLLGLINLMALSLLRKG